MAEEDGLEDGRVEQQLLEHSIREGLEGSIVRSEDGDVRVGENLVQS